MLFSRTSRLCLAAALLALTVLQPAQARERYTVAWTLYAGSMPLAYADETGILKKWGDRYGFDLEAVQMNDYIEAITQFSLGQFDAVIAMSLDALTIPAASGVDTTVIMPLSTSNGSDGIVVRGKGKTVADLEGLPINLVELSGSHYMLVRALDSVGLEEKDVTVVNTSDADISSVFEAADTQAVATWKPQLSEILAQYPDTSLVFDSSDIHGELLDVMIARSDALADNPDLGRAIAGAWFEAAALLQADHPRHGDFMGFTAATLNTDKDGARNQLSTIDFLSAQQGRELVRGEEFAGTQKKITGFAFDHGLLGDGVPDAGFVGIETGRGTVIGNPDNVKLRFPTTWLEAQ
ncbi:putative urea ABC transporter substrate-binding protein [Alloalcanivorax sp. C16-2]|uniref:putative urea ABC transporter substrate-binding protein n=1 Tax=Alloalcanivorax sp. C16-2 TaxID=3390052 RepID=UPI003970FBD0